MKMAEARKLNAEADSIEIQNSLKRLKIALGGIKVLAISDGNKDLVILKQLDNFLKTIDAIQEDKMLE